MAVGALTFSTLAMIARSFPLSSLVALINAVSAPYAALAAAAAMAFFLVRRRIALSVVAVVIVATNLAIQVPWYYFGTPATAGDHVEVRVLSSNLRKGQADADFFVSLAKQNADVITVSELTPEAIQQFSQAGIDEVFPYSVLAPGFGAAGIGLWSRFPLAELTPGPRAHTATVAAKLQVPGVRFDVVVGSVHVSSPVASDENSFGEWRHGIMSLSAEVDGFADAAGFGAVVVAGDFNSTADMRQFRELLTNGYRDAVEQTGAGFAPTFPSNTWFPPLITIDHVLTRQAAATAIRTVDVRGSDHRSLLATINVPRDPTAKKTLT